MPQSSRQHGNRTENRLGALLRDRGYCVFYSRGSRGIDLIALPSDPEQDYGKPHLAVEVGRRGKLIRDSFEKLREAAKPIGTREIVARYLRKPGKRDGWWRIHIDCDVYFDDLDLALQALREAA